MLANLLVPEWGDRYTSALLDSKNHENMVVCARSGFAEVLLGGEVVRCRIRGRLKKGRMRSDLVVIGDRVNVVGLPDSPVIESVEPRRTVFSRQHPAQRGRPLEDVLIANLDRLFVVMAHTDPPPKARLLDRFLAICEHNEIEAQVVLNKADLSQPLEIEATYRALGYEVLRVSAESGEGIDTLRERLAGHVSAFVGPSGVGKSSLLNALDSRLSLDTGAVSDSHYKGRHTTRVARLLPVPTGGYVADTPGIRELGTYAIAKEELAECYVELRPHLGTCGFGDCRHLVEPRCSLIEAVERGDVSAERWDSYQRLYEEMRAAEPRP